VSAPRFDFEDVFDEDYLFFYEPLLADDVTDAEVDAIWGLLDLEPRVEVLDLACGHGRIANRLAERGARVTGLDATPLFIERARQDAAARGVQVDYLVGDMRALPWPQERFDRIVSWFTSFGYFDDADNRRVLAEAHRVLRPSGALLIEHNNLVELLPRWQPAVVTERDGHFAIDRSRYDPVTGRATTERVLIRDGRIRRFSFSVRMFVGAELRDWLLQAGFATVDLLDRDGTALTPRSRRMLAIARR
jgi:SAM-dependent methyltransferase